MFNHNNQGHDSAQPGGGMATDADMEQNEYGVVTATALDEDNPALPQNDHATFGSASQTGSNDDLLAIKQQALQQLSPLIGHLDQTPEEKFRTTMMMIQASDNQSLLKTAHEAALRISDEKVKAQALLDLVNEINYFTHQSAQ